MADDFLRISGVSKRFGGTLAVNNVDLDISRGEFFSLLGPSGCGKTTLLRMIGGFAMPDSGAILIDGEDMTDVPPNARPTNMVFQSYAIFPHLNVGDNIGYGLRRQKLTNEARERRIKDALELIKLDGFEHRRANELSGGERQRVALARALVMQPKVLLLDEPLGALDKRLRESMQIELRELQRRLAITFVFVTHDQEEALSMSDRVGVMDKGKLLQVADPRTLYDAPANRTVASFIGTMNFFQGQVRETTGGNLVVDTVEHIRMTAAAGARNFAPGDRVVIAIRPEKIVIAKERGAGNGVRGVLNAVSYLGDRELLQVGVDGVRDPILVSTQESAIKTGVRYKPGDQVFVTWPPEAAIVLPE